MPTVLNQHFLVHGLFYEWHGSDFRKRAVLELVRVDATNSTATEPPQALPAEALDIVPDICVVMMNPGSSAPLPGFGQQADEGVLVPAKPDLVQYQIMRLMALLGLRHARVVNLSDLRAAQSAELYRVIESGADDKTLGALFSGESRLKPERIVTAQQVVCGWGLDKRLANLAHQAYRWLEAHDKQLHGVRAPREDFPAYRYPKPVGNWQAAVAWLEQTQKSMRSTLA